MTFSINKSKRMHFTALETLILNSLLRARYKYIYQIVTKICGILNYYQIEG